MKRREKRTWTKTGAKQDIGIKIKTLGGGEEKKSRDGKRTERRERGTDKK